MKDRYYSKRRSPSPYSRRSRDNRRSPSPRRIRDGSRDRTHKRDARYDERQERQSFHKRERLKQENAKVDKQENPIESAPVSMEFVEDDALAMQELLGFSGFDSTKGKKVQQDVGIANAVKRRNYRQYLNKKRPPIEGQQPSE